MYSFPLNIGAARETVEVQVGAVQMQTQPSVLARRVSGATDLSMSGKNEGNMPPATPGVAQQNASANVVNLQKRVAGVLPVPIDVPRAGTSFAFVRPLVLDEETKVTFSYKSR